MQLMDGLDDKKILHVPVIIEAFTHVRYVLYSLFKKK